MATVTDNLPEVLADMAKFAEFGFETEAGPHNLGEACVEIIVDGIRERSIERQEAPSGSRWPDNAPEYARRKGGLPVSIGKARAGVPSGGDMMSKENLRGDVEIEPSTLEMTYGSHGWARRKANWFAAGSDGEDGEPSGAIGQPPRPFYDLDERIEAKIDALVDRTARNFLGLL